MKVSKRVIDRKNADGQRDWSCRPAARKSYSNLAQHIRPSLHVHSMTFSSMIFYQVPFNIVVVFTWALLVDELQQLI